MKTLAFLLFFFTVGAYAAPTAVRDIESSCASSDSVVTCAITIQPGSPAPTSMVLQEDIPEGWTLVSSTWNGSPLPPDQASPPKWLFGLSVPLEAGILRLTLQPSAALEREYSWTGSLRYGTSSVVPVTGDSTLVACDQDQDRLPDDWERKYFNNSAVDADPTDDPDEDGADNLAEYEARTNPQQASSSLRILSLNTSSTPWVLRAFSGANSSVTLRYAESLSGEGLTYTVGVVYFSQEGEESVSFLSPLNGFLYLETSRD